MRIYLNAGHGGKDPGAVNGSRHESDDVLRLAKAVKPLLEGAGHKVIMSRTKDTYTSVTQIAQQANQADAHLFIALHRNAATATATGNEMLVSSKASETSRKMAAAIQQQICMVGGKDRGVKQQDTRTHVLQATKMPACTVELGFISNPQDNSLFDKNFEKYAQAIANGIFRVANDEKTRAYSRLLKQGMHGPDIKYIKQLVKSLGYPKISASDRFGSELHKAVKDLQKKHTLTVDGIIGPKTWALITHLHEK